MAKIIDEEVERYGRRSADNLSQKAIIEAIPYPLFIELKANAEKVAYGYVMLILGSILVLAALWSFAALGLGPPFFGIFSLGWTLVSLGVIISGAKSVKNGRKALRNLSKDVISSVKKVRASAFQERGNSVLE